MKALGIHTLLFSLVFGLSGTAWAQAAPEQGPAPNAAPAPAPTPAAPAQPPAPVYVPADGAPATQAVEPAQPAPAYYAPPPPMETTKPGARLHDGFYLRMSFGIGSGSATETLQTNGASSPDVKFTGTAMMFDLLIGGSPVPGFVLGGGLVGHRILSPKLKVGGVDYGTANSDVSLDLSTIGLFTAIYPDPTSGFNVHALLGYGVISVSDGNNNTSSNNPSGLSIMGGIGYDFWVGEQWSLGPDLRVAYAKTSYSVDGSEDKVSMFVPTLSFTATYH